MDADAFMMHEFDSDLYVYLQVKVRIKPMHHIIKFLSCFESKDRQTIHFFFSGDCVTWTQMSL